MTNKCECISNNRPEKGGTEKSVYREFPVSFNYQDKQGVLIDPCIADIIQELWDAGVETAGSCCGHNGSFDFPFDFPSVIISNKNQKERAKKVVGDRMTVWYWDLLEQKEVLSKQSS